MTTLDAPRIDKRRIGDLVDLIERTPLRFGGEDIRGLRRHFAREWRSDDTGPEGRDLGLVLDRLFARLMAILIEHVNRVPRKHFAAFLDRVGAERRAGTAARVPVTFVASPGLSRPRSIRRGTQVATAQTGDSRAVIFETVKGFELSGAELSQAALLDPVRDRWLDLAPWLVEGAHETVPPQLFTPGAGDQRVEHALYLAHDGLLAAGDARDIRVRIAIASPGGFASTSVAWEGWDGESWVPISSPDGHLWPTAAGTVDVTLPGFAGSAPLALREGEPERAWIRTRLDLAGLSTPGVLPRIQDLLLGVEAPVGQQFVPEEAFANSRPVDLGKDFYPFTERPSQNDAFYLRSPVLEHGDPATTRTVTLQFKLAPIPGSGAFPTGTAVVAYEYPARDGTWKQFTVAGADEPTSSFRSGGSTLTSLTFDVQPDFVRTTVNGSEGAWIRLRILTGDYGHDTRWLPGSTPNVDPANYTPPFLSVADLRLSYSVAGALGTRPEACRSQNHFEWTEHPTDGGAPFTPIVSLADRGELQPSLWLGYDRPFDNASVSQLLRLEPPDAALLRQEASDDPPRIAWDYHSASGWKPLAVRDDTQALSSSSTLAFPAPGDWTYAPGFGQAATWLRARHAGGVIRAPRRLLGVHPNSVWAESTRSLSPDSVPERIGSGSGEKPQRVVTSSRPLRRGEVLRVREPNPPPADVVEELEREEARLAAELGRDPVPVVRSEPDPSGDGLAHWVRWYPIANRRGARPWDRKYVIDRVDGTIDFTGMAVPRGRDNIRFDSYEVDTGERARDAAAVGAVSQLVTSLPFVNEVVNHLPAEGGSAPEQLDDVLARGPSDLKHRDRAVTREDFEALARVADTGLSIVRVYPVTNADGERELGAVTVMVVPDSLEREPQPSPALTRRIRSFLQHRASGTAMHRVFVIGPTYVRVSVSARIVPSDPTEASTLAARVTAALDGYLHPLRGGRDGGGWGLGADISVSDVYAFLESLPGVEYAVHAGLDGMDGEGRVRIPDTQLPSAGTVAVEVTTGGGG